MYSSPEQNCFVSPPTCIDLYHVTITCLPEFCNVRRVKQVWDRPKAAELWNTTGDRRRLGHLAAANDGSDSYADEGGDFSQVDQRWPPNVDNVLLKAIVKLLKTVKKIAWKVIIIVQQEKLLKMLR